MIARVVVLVLLLTGCATTPQVTRVDRDQPDYQMPDFYTVTVAVAPLVTVATICGNPLALGCAYWTGAHKAFVWLSDVEYADHEFEHLIFGPLHY